MKTLSCLICSNETKMTAMQFSNHMKRHTGEYAGRPIAGTPQTLIGAIQNGLGDDAGDNHENYSKTLHNHVRDYLSQAFAVAMCKAPTIEEGERLKALFKRLVNES